MRKSLTLSLAAVALVSATSCNEQLDVIATTSTEATYQDKLAEFAANFEKEFGTPDPNHTWGWDMTPEMADAILGQSRGVTRAGTDPYNHAGRVNTNRNMWCTKGDPYSLLNVYGVPGWPNWDGRYYTQEGTYTNGRYPIYDTQQNSCNMPGDVTEFEILWVSNQMHYLTTYPTVKLHISDYYIQQISTNGDYDTDEAYKSGSVSQYGGVGSNGNNYNYDNYAMDYLNAKSLGGESTWTHINNFNAKMNYQPNRKVGNNADRNIIYVQSAGTEDFNYHPSNATDGATFDKWILVEFSWDEPLNPDWSKVKTAENPSGLYTLEEVLADPSKLGETKRRTGYYLCFDFQCTKDSEGWSKYEGDGVYDNWILKLTPGYPVQKDRWPKRLMCEDLGNTFDFDFNDAVFDLSFGQNVENSNAYDMIVVIQAAGGTMPIQVALPLNWTGSNVEIHHLLGGNESTTPVNVIKGGAKAAPAMYRMKNVFTFDPSSLSKIDTGAKDNEGNAILVPNYNSSETLLAQMAACAFTMQIHVKNGGSWESVSGYDLYKGLRDNYNNGSKSTNAVPQLFNCSTDAKWTYENGHIKDAYKHFADWVQDEQCDYRLRWDEKQYFYRDGQGNQPILKQHEQSKIDSWKGSWDYGVATATSWGLSSEFIDKSKCWGGNGPE